MRTTIMRDLLLGGLLLAAASVAWAAPATVGLTPAELRAIRHVSRGVLLAKHNGPPTSAQLALQTTVKDLESAINHHIALRASRSMRALKAQLGTPASASVAPQTAAPIDDSDLKSVLAKLKTARQALSHGPSQPTGSLNDALSKVDEKRAARLEGEVQGLLATTGKNRLSQLVALRKDLEGKQRARVAVSPTDESPAPTLSTAPMYRPVTRHLDTGSTTR